MKSIKEEDGIQKEWYAEAGKQTLETLPEFINHLMNDYNHDYGTVCHAIAAGSIATAWAMNGHKNGGITGFQAGAVMWKFIKNWQFTSNKSGLKIMDYDNMLFPQYADKFEKTISKRTWDSLQKQAFESLKSNDHAHPDVKSHWQTIADGRVPFGYVVIED